MSGVKLPLTCTVANGMLTIRVNAATVKFATENHPAFWNAETNTFSLKVSDPKKWLQSVGRAITAELGEDGSTLLTELFDKAIYNAAERGEEGLSDE